MEQAFKKMDNRVIHLRPYPRRFKLLPAVENIGFVPAKTERIARVFGSCNFSFILSGRGTYAYAGRDYAVEAPCVFLQWPGAPMDYGPAPGTTWDELFLIYSARAGEVLRRSGVFLPGPPPVRPLGGAVLDAVSRLYDRTAAAAPDADAIDVACWDLIVASHRVAPCVDEGHRIVERCREHLRRHPGGAFAVTALAEALGMSPSSLRRVWRRVHGIETFSEFRDAQLLQRSCRMLIETRHCVKEIAAQLGFCDAYYFSRRFRQLAGCTPTAYRQARAVHLTAGRS